MHSILFLTLIYHFIMNLNKKRLVIEVPREGAPKKAKLPNAKRNIPTKDICEKFKKILANCISEGSYIIDLHLIND